MLAELSGGIVLPLLDPSASPVGEAFLFLSPSSGRAGENSTPGDAENAFFRVDLNVICSEIVEREPQVIY